MEQFHVKKWVFIVSIIYKPVMRYPKLPHLARFSNDDIVSWRVRVRVDPVTGSG